MLYFKLFMNKAWLMHMKKMRDIWLFIMQTSTLSHWGTGKIHWRKILSPIVLSEQLEGFYYPTAVLLLMSSQSRYQIWQDISVAWLAISWSQICISKYRRIGRCGHCMPITSLCVCIAQSRTLEHCSRLCLNSFQTWLYSSLLANFKGVRSRFHHSFV